MRIDATPLFITSVAHKTTVPAVIASTSCPVRERPAGVGRNAISRPIRMPAASQIHLPVDTLEAAAGAATEVLIRTLSYQEGPLNDSKLRYRLAVRMGLRRAALTIP